MIEHVCGRLGAALVAAALAGSLAAAQTGDQAQADIRAALLKWTADFNARNLGEVCDLFAPDLRYDYQGFPGSCASRSPSRASATAMGLRPSRTFWSTAISRSCA
jgi:hypothetical protein